VRLAGGEAIWLPQLLLDAGLVASTSEGRRMIQQGAVTVAGDKASDVNMKIAAEGEIIIKVGKRRFARVIFT
jgi:tyrosyl-tRNA synthetase